MGGFLIIGITGTFAAGKDTVADHLEKIGFEHFSCGEQVREIAVERGIEPTRDNMREVGNQLRDEKGSDFLAKRIIEQKAKTDRIVITGIRQPGEIKYLQDLGDFYLIAVDAPIELRFERMQARKRPGDPETLEELREKEAKEMQSSGPNAQRINECMEMADFHLVNDGDMEKLGHAVDEIVEKIEGKGD